MPEGKHLYEFGPFRLDPAERSLLRDGKAVALTPKAFELLVLLVENRGHLLKKEELIERVWPNTFVEEANLAQTSRCCGRRWMTETAGHSTSRLCRRVGIALLLRWWITPRRPESNRMRLNP